jgi:cytoskeleton protein RodZ
MAAISETLRQARLRSGVDLDKLAAKTKINPRYLRAIETGEFDKLPGGIFARMFVKQYADALGLDGASFAEEFQRSSQFGNYSPDIGTTAESRADFHPSVRGLSSTGERVRDERLTSALSSLIWVLAAILVCAGAYYGLAHLPGRAGSMTADAPVAKPRPESVPKPAPQIATSGQTPAPETPPVPVAAPVAPPVDTAEKAGQGPAPQTDQAPSAIQLTLNATQTVWVTAIADGKTVISEALQPGVSKIVAASKGARLTIGNAGGLDITFNGKKLEPFGPSGQVRTVDFTSWGAQVVSRTPPSPDPLR